MTDLYEEAWNVLSEIDVSEKVEKKGTLSYLSWAWAIGILNKHYPNNAWTFNEERYDDGSVMIYCDLHLRKGDQLASRHMWLPVMDFKNKSLLNPTSKDISDSKMRCLTKCIGMFGLGHYLYAGEDMPEGSKPVHGKKIQGEDMETWLDYCIAFREALDNEDGVQIFTLEQELKEDNNDHILDGVNRALNSKRKAAWKKLVEEARKSGAIAEAIKNKTSNKPAEQS